MDKKEITVYYTDTKEADAERLLVVYRDDMEQKRITSIDKCSNINVRKQMICAGALVAKVLKEKGFCASDITYGEHGKPFLNREDVFFNLSHSGSILMLAWGDMEIGADVQKSVTFKQNLVNKITCEGERTGREDEYRNHLNRVWAVKESYTKLTGEGIGLDFSTIRYESVGDGLKITCEGRQPAFCRSIDLHTDYEAFVSAYCDFSVTAVKVCL